MTKSARYAALGALAGLAAGPAGWAARLALGAAAGWLLGRQRDVLESERCSCRSTRKVLNRLALTDGLTRLHNRRSLDEHLAQELDEAARYGNPLSVLLLDVDDFKRLNDAYGHTFGDAVLTGIGRATARTVRRADVAGRWGGEEFLVVTPRLGAQAALAAAERLRAAIAAKDFLYEGRPVRVTVSVGVASAASLPEPRRTPRELVAAADRALYAAKRAGKNRCALDAPAAAVR